MIRARPLLLALTLFGFALGFAPGFAPSFAQDRATLMAAHRGGAMRLLAHSAAGTLDPHVNYTAQYWQLYCFTHDGLVAFRKVPGAAGLEIVPDLAETMQGSEDGLRYTFLLRRSVRFSNGSELRPADVVASFRRIFKVRSPSAETFFGAIEGAAECLRDPEACTLPGVSAEGQTITFRLTRPDPEFLTKLALPHASILPESAPTEDAGTALLPGTGPYKLDFYDPNAELRIVRNPYFREWSADAQPDGFPDTIEYAFGLEDEAEVTAVQNGQADWMFDAPPADRLAELGARFAGHVQLNPAFALWFLAMNVHLSPFDDVNVRRAVNLAVDRDAAVKLFGGHRLATASCQILPPGLPGYAPYCPYRHDPEEARRLVQASGKAGQSVTLVTDDSPVARSIGTYLRDILSDLGFPARLRSLSGNVQFTYIQNTENRVQISLTNWYADYPSSANIILGAFGCSAFHPGSDSSPNIPGFCDAALDAQVQQALLHHDPAGIAAVDRAITDQAPASVLLNPRYIDFISARVGGYAYHETFRWIIDQSWVR